MPDGRLQLQRRIRVLALPCWLLLPERNCENILPCWVVLFRGFAKELAVRAGLVEAAELRQQLVAGRAEWARTEGWRTVLWSPTPGPRVLSLRVGYTDRGDRPRKWRRSRPLVDCRRRPPGSPASRTSKNYPPSSHVN